MNLWDILIVLAIAVAVVAGVHARRKSKKNGNSCCCSGDCSKCKK